MIDTQQDKVVRGNILACDGTVLASTQINEEGEEYRYYPFSNMYCHVVGFKKVKRQELKALQILNYIINRWGI